MIKRTFSRKILKEIEQKWKLKLGESGETENFQFQSTKYILPMFPYPSGNLHMGHVRVYSISDCLARFERLRLSDNKISSSSSSSSSNYSSYSKVLHPMGWDAFGLPAENAAINAAIQPSKWTDLNISQMRAQLKDKLGFDFNWTAEIKTCDPNYYKWTQWLFLKMYEKGWAYQSEGPVAWDPVDRTVLAAEQVDSDGRSWRSGAIVEKRMLPQWYLKITDFAEDLLDGLEGLQWPDSVKDMQRHWIGKTEGALITFKTDCGNHSIKGTNHSFSF